MNYYVYKITNTKTGEFYIGKRQCNCPVKQDPYMGSGVKIKASVNELGVNTFTKKILAICRDNDELAAVENAYVGHNIYNNFCLNLAEGADVNSKRYFRKKYKSTQRELQLQKEMYKNLKIKFNLLYNTHQRILKDYKQLENAYKNIKKLNFKADKHLKIKNYE